MGIGEVGLANIPSHVEDPQLRQSHGSKVSSDVFEPLADAVVTQAVDNPQHPAPENPLANPSTTTAKSQALETQSKPFRHVFVFKGWGKGGAEKPHLFGSGSVTQVAKDETPRGKTRRFGYWQKDEALKQALQMHAKDPSGVFEIYGHSWGSQGAVELATELRQRNIPVTFIATLDPVGWMGIDAPPKEIPWVNVHQPLSPLDYVVRVPILGQLIVALLIALSRIVPPMGSSNFVATLGRQRGHQKGAVNVPTDLVHWQTDEMLRLAEEQRASGADASRAGNTRA